MNFTSKFNASCSARLTSTPSDVSKITLKPRSTISATLSRGLVTAQP